MTRAAGFTLVEVLMAASTAALLFAAFSALLRGGHIVWTRTTDGLERLRQQRAMLDRMAQDVTNAVAFPTDDEARPSVRFEPEHLQLYTVQPTHTEDRPARLWWVEYVMEEIPAGRALARRARPFHPALQGGDDAAAVGATQQRFTGIEGIAFRYGHRDPDLPTGIRWSAVWEDDAVPRYVEVTVQSSGRMPIRHLLHIPAGDMGHDT